MSSTKKNKPWLLIKWNSGGRSVVSLDSVIGPLPNVKVGTVVTVERCEGSRETASIIGYSHYRRMLEWHISKDEPKEEPREEKSQIDVEQEDKELENFLAKPLDLKRLKLSSSKKHNRTPNHNADVHDAVQANIPKRKDNIAMTTEGNEHSPIPDSAGKRIKDAPNKPSDIISINVQDLIQMKQCFEQLFSITQELRRYAASTSQTSNTETDINISTQIKHEIKSERDNTFNFDEENAEHDIDMGDRSEVLNRSEDNVLISNKYNTAKTNIVFDRVKNQNRKSGDWIPIGSGKTVIHKEQYRKIDWTSYARATRSLLIALFPRSVLATHSLTGKSSPAFQDKPAKLRLDPYIVSDIVEEVARRFEVQDNHIRSIITTKCADECKMFKMRQKAKHKKKPLPASANKENANVGDEDHFNMTC